MMDNRNACAYLLAQELGKAVDRFAKKHQGVDLGVILGAGILFIPGFLVSFSKQEAMETLKDCCEAMQEQLSEMPDTCFNGGVSDLVKKMKKSK